MARWRDIKQGKREEPQTKSSTHMQASASIPSRLKAFLTDTFLITTPILYLVIYFIMGSGEDFSHNRTTGWLIILAMHLSVILFFWVKKSQTPGLKAYSLKLISTKNRPTISFIQALVRYVATLVAVLSVCLLFIPFLRKDKRSFQDIFSHTYIVHE